MGGGKEGQLRVLVVDLNNFARYPSIAVGYLTGVLRQSGLDVRVLSPFAHGYRGVVRETRVRPWGLLDQRLRYWSATTDLPLVRALRTRLVRWRQPRLARSHQAFLRRVQAALRDGVDAVVISTYLMYDQLCESLCRLCAAAGRPVLVGGPYFAQPSVARAWLTMPGLTALVGGEPEAFLGDLVRALARGGDVSGFPGVFTKHTVDLSPAPPLTDLDRIPFPDYADFPWDAYPNRMVPIITGRGCGWGVCTFCSDVTSSAGRTFRSRSPDNVLSEVAYQAARHDARSFVFTDLKLNSNPRMWEALVARMQETVPGAQWIGSVHIGPDTVDHFGPEQMRAAAAAGLVRITTGLESGSQRVNDAMKKGVDHAVTARVLRAADEAGISVRATMILGYPGEQAEDVDASAAFVERNADVLERITLNRLQIVAGTPMHRAIEERRPVSAGLRILGRDDGQGQLAHRYPPMHTPTYRRSVTRLLRAVHRVNRKSLKPAARIFDGVM